MSAESLDAAVVEKLQHLVRANLAGRDALHTAAASLDGEGLQRLCRRLADSMGGHVADLNQLLMAHGSGAIGPDDQLMTLLRSAIDQEFAMPSSAGVVDRMATAQEHLHSDYTAAIQQADDPQLKTILQTQRHDAARSQDTLAIIKQSLEPTKDAGD